MYKKNFDKENYCIELKKIQRINFLLSSSVIATPKDMKSNTQVVIILFFFTFFVLFKTL